MPKTQTKRGMSPRELDALRKQFVAEQKQIDSASKWQLANDIASGINDIIGRGVIAPILGMPGDINQAIYDAGAWVNNKIKDVEVATGMVKQPRYVQPSQGNAYLGSEDIGNRMEQAGLVSSERRPMTELAASFVSPSAVAKTAINAPKTAMNALRMVENLETPSRGVRTADGMYIPRGQMGAIDVWHGSPHEYEQFSAMGNAKKGRGREAYGAGGYHSSSPDVAGDYAAELSNKGTPHAEAKRLVNRHDGDIDAASRNIREVLTEEPNHQNKEYLAETLRILDSGEYKEPYKNQGYLYRNQLRWPDAAREASDPLSDKHFLEWDKPLSEQGGAARFSAIPDYARPIDDIEASNINGQRLYQRLANEVGDTEASNILRQAGIPGIRYLDAGSRSAGQGTSNYVTFSDNLVNILERNGVPVTAPQPGLKK